jgi:hypothetical protein
MTRGDCGQEARPCPWVGCRHHLLFEVAESKGPGRRGGRRRDLRPTSLRLNRASRGRVTLGRRRGLASSAAQRVVRQWMDDALEELSNKMYTCTLDVTRDYPDGLAESSVALLLGVTEHAINAEAKAALVKFKAGMLALEREGDRQR